MTWRSFNHIVLATPIPIERLDMIEDLEYRHTLTPSPVLATVRGIAAPYESWATVPWFGGASKTKKEKIERGAFNVSLYEARAGRRNIRAFAGHEPEMVLASTRRETLRFEEREDGLHYEIDLPDTQAGRDLMALVKRGEIGASIGFLRSGSDITSGTDTNTGEAWDVLRQVDLYELSLTSVPAYESTTAVIARSKTVFGAIDWRFADADI